LSSSGERKGNICLKDDTRSLHLMDVAAWRQIDEWI